jgi:hypothetical protein
MTDSGEDLGDDVPEGSPDPSDLVSEPAPSSSESQSGAGDAGASAEVSQSGEDSPQGAGGKGPAAGWYPDPNAGGSNNMRYWDGSTWTHQIKEGLTEVNTTRRSSDERKAILARQLQSAVARGLRIESQSDYQAVLVQGKPVNHTLHAIITIFSCGLWGIVWIVMAITGGEKREMIVVDEFGNVQLQKLGKA